MDSAVASCTEHLSWKNIPRMPPLKLTIGAISILTLLCVVVLYQFLIIPSYIRLEHDQALRDLSRVDNFLHREMAQLSMVATDYSTWDDMYDFVNTRSPKFIETNLAPDYLQHDLKLSNLEIHDSGLIPVWSANFQSDGSVPAPNLQGLVEEGKKLSLLRRALDSPGAIEGLVAHGGEVYLLSIRKISKSDGTGINGVLAMARKLSPDYIAEMRRTIATDFALSTEVPPEAPDASEALKVVELSESTLLASRNIPDILGNPVARIEAKIDRTVLAQGKKAAALSAAAVLVIGALLILFSYASNRFAETLQDRMVELARAVEEKNHEIDERQAVEEKLHASVKSLALEVEKSGLQARLLHESEARSKALLEAIPDPIFVLAEDGTFLDFSSSNADKLAFSPEDFLGKKIYDIMPAKLTEPLKVKIAEVLQTGRPRMFEYDLPMNGKRLFYEARLTRTGDGEILLICSDITEKKELEEKRKHYEEQARHSQKIEALGTLSGGVAHEFNNILQILAFKVEVMKMLARDNPTLLQGMDELEGFLKRGADLVRNLLSFSHKQSTERIPVYVNSEIRGALEILLPTLPKNIQITTSLAENLRLICASPGLISQVMLNLASNARDAMPSGGEITVTTRDVENCQALRDRHPDLTCEHYIELVFADTGTGMDNLTLQRIFEPFFTTKEVGKGTGLGLSIVYGILKDHGGHVECHSAPGNGTEFHILLPADTGRKKTVVGARTPEPQNYGTRKCLLLVDDELAIREVLEVLLKARGYEVLLADSGEMALAIFKDNAKRVNCVVLDLGMPGMGGEACLVELRRLSPKIPVIVATGYGPQAVASLIEKPTRVISKPYTLSAMAQTIERVIEVAEAKAKEGAVSH